MPAPDSSNHAIVPGRCVAVNVSGQDHLCRATMAALYVGTTGDVLVEDLDGTQVTLSTVPVGFYTMRVAKVLDATTASDMVEFFA